MTVNDICFYLVLIRMFVLLYYIVDTCVVLTLAPGPPLTSNSFIASVVLRTKNQWIRRKRKSASLGHQHRLPPDGAP